MLLKKKINHHIFSREIVVCKLTIYGRCVSSIRCCRIKCGKEFRSRRHTFFLKQAGTKEEKKKISWCYSSFFQEEKSCAQEGCDFAHYPNYIITFLRMVSS